jgi:hypothetical protein
MSKTKGEKTMRMIIRNRADARDTRELAIIATPESDGRVRVTPSQARRLIKHFSDKLGGIYAPFESLAAYDAAGKVYQLIAWYE